MTHMPHNLAGFKAFLKARFWRVLGNSQLCKLGVILDTAARLARSKALGL